MTIRDMQYAIQGAIDNGLLSDDAEMTALMGDGGDIIYYGVDKEGAVRLGKGLGTIDCSSLGLQELSLVLGLTNLQIVQLHTIGTEIADGADSFQPYADSLSCAERIYLKAWMRREGLPIPDEETEDGKKR